MATLHIQHAVNSFEAWKRAFDSDPIGRKASGVRRHRVRRAVAEPDLVMIDLEFDDVPQAKAFLEKLRRLWSGGPAQSLMRNPQAWVTETVEEVAG